MTCSSHRAGTWSLDNRRDYCKTTVMYIKHLLLQNFRCFGPVPHVVTLSPSGLTALIGPNNTGKSTVLQALDILLGDRWPSGRFTEDDFHNNALDQPIQLACEFSETITAPYYSGTIQVRGLVLTAKHLPSGYGEASVEVEFYPLADIHDFENSQWTVASRGGGNPIRVSQELKNSLPVVVTIPLIKLAREQPSNKWGVLGRMMQKIERRFTADQVAEQSFREKIHAAVDVLRSPQDFRDLEADLKRLWEDMKPSNLGDTSLEFLDFEPWRYYRQFRLAIRRGSADVPIDTLGEGVQRLAVIALYRAYLRRHGRSQRAVLLIEEPESYLHPQARATVFRVLRRAISAEDNVEGQIIFTTHSEDFVDCGHFSDVVVFGQDRLDVTIRRMTSDDANKHAQALNRMGTPPTSPAIFYRLLETTTVGLKEALFAQKAIIVEGATELELFGLLSDSHRAQIALVSAGGKSNIPGVLTFLTGLGVPCLVATDRDNENPRDNERIAEALSQVNAAYSDDTAVAVTAQDIDSVPDGSVWTRGRLLVFAKNVEAVLGARLTNYSALASAVRDATNVPANSKPKTMRAIGLAYRGAIRSQEVQREVTTAKPALDALCAELTTFASHTLSIPELLIPRP